MKRLLMVVTLALVPLLGLVANAAAVQSQPNDGVLDASQRVAGFTAGELLGEEWRQLLELPSTSNPYTGTGDNCLKAGNKDKVLILWTTVAPVTPASCDVKPGTPVFFSTLNGECSSAEPPPYFGATEEEQRQCILGLTEDTTFDAILVSVDGGAPVNIGLDRFLAVSGQGSVYLADPNILGVPGNENATFVAAAYSVMLRPLHPGTHTIKVKIVGGSFDGTINRAVINVVPGLNS
jgi:hypothetical protein